MKILYLLLCLLLCFGASAQQVPHYSQYIFNSMAINPAYTGSKKVLNLNALHRSQWTGMEGAPTTQSLNADGLTASDRLGLGLSVTRDKIGEQSMLTAYGNAAVKLQVSETGVLSLGMAAGLVQHKLDGLELGITGDPSIPSGNQVWIKPDLKLGLYYHTNRFYAGISASDILQFDEVQQLEPERHYFFTTGYVFDMGSNIRFKPSILVKEDFNAPANVDLNAFFLLHDMLWLGTSYRTSLGMFDKTPADPARLNRTALALIAEIQINKAFRLGYSYDKMLNDLRGMHTHEISVGYYFFRKQDTPMLTPQYF